MAKTYRRRRYYRRKSGRWSSNIKDILDSQTVSNGTNGNSVDLCLNPVQSDLTVSQQYTVKNIELSIFLECGAEVDFNKIENIQHYIMYVPQGMNLTTNYNLEHPEYIMTYYYQGNPNLDSSSTNNGVRLKIKTRLARRLQTGDRIIYFWKCNNESNISYDIVCRGLVRWWTKAN